ncbi:hypothetical protein [Halosimplex sp. TS25]|uniref:hypothetical protein n=1 Tax=Halosimplex rarum TaxID=3396619 RepID=UPI0039EA8EFF
MPESNTEYLGYYPPGWTEYCIDDRLVEWALDRDVAIRIRVDGTLEADRFTVQSVTGVNEHGEEFIVGSFDTSSEQIAYQIARLLLYAMNGTVGRITGDDQYRGDQS